MCSAVNRCSLPSQALAFLSTVWSADLRAGLHFAPARDLAEATHVKVTPHAFVGTTEIVPLHGKMTVRQRVLGGWCWAARCIASVGEQAGELQRSGRPLDHVALFFLACNV